MNECSDKCEMAKREFKLNIENASRKKKQENIKKIECGMIFNLPQDVIFSPIILG